MQIRTHPVKKTFLTGLAVLCFFCVRPLFADSKNIVYSNTFAIADITDLKISLDYEELRINQIYGDEISIEIGCNNLSLVPSVQLQDNVLSIQGAGTHKQSKAIKNKGNVCTVYVYIPQDFMPGTINISLQSSNLMAEVLRASTAIVISSTSGRIDLMESHTESLTVKNVSGNTTIQKIKVDYFDLRSTSGLIFAELAQAPLARCSIQNKSGKVQLYYPKDAQLPQIDISSKSDKTEIKPF